MKRSAPKFFPAVVSISLYAALTLAWLESCSHKGVQLEVDLQGLRRDKLSYKAGDPPLKKLETFAKAHEQSKNDLEEFIAEYRAPKTPAVAKTSEEPVAPANAETFGELITHNWPEEDPRLAQAIRQLCRAEYQSSVDYVQKLRQPMQDFVLGRLLSCHGKRVEAIAALQRIYPKLTGARFAVLKVEALRQIVFLTRSDGTRELMTATYRDLVRSWTSPVLNPRTMGLPYDEFWKERINHHLAYIRDLALEGQYDEARFETQQLMQLGLDQGFSGSALQDLLAEALLQLASRVYVEEKNFLLATQMVKQALDLKFLSPTWEDRLRWFAAFYTYMGGRYQEAVAAFDVALAAVKDPSTRPALLFWKARALAQLEEFSDAKDQLATLTEETPLSFYALVARKFLPEKLQKDFPSWISDAAKEHVVLNAEKAPSFYEGNSLRLRRQVIFLTAAGVPENAAAVLRRLKAKGKDFKEKEQEEFLVDLTRLHAAQGDFYQTIATTTAMQNSAGFWQRNPEQVIVYYPVPFLRTLTPAAKSAGLPPAMVLAVSRQESAFAPRLKSSAGAVGLMQLLPQTARAEAMQASMTVDGGFNNSLLEPETSLRLGSLHLARLQGNLRPLAAGDVTTTYAATFAAYNAGEKVVRRWLEKRYSGDPLAFIELIPYAETRQYVKNILRNMIIYEHIAPVEGSNS